MHHPFASPGLDREEPDLWIEDDIPSSGADEAEDEERAQAREKPEG